MLLNNFFTIQSLDVDASSLKAEIEINPAHPILEAHFPGQPVVPGVCMVDMLKEVAQVALGKKLQLQSAPAIKFLTMFSPLKGCRAEFSSGYHATEDQKINLSATLSAADMVFFKFNGTFRVV